MTERERERKREREREREKETTARRKHARHRSCPCSTGVTSQQPPASVCAGEHRNTYPVNPAPVPCCDNDPGSTAYARGKEGNSTESAENAHRQGSPGREGRKGRGRGATGGGGHLGVRCFCASLAGPASAGEVHTTCCTCSTAARSRSAMPREITSCCTAASCVRCFPVQSNSSVFVAWFAMDPRLHSLTAALASGLCTSVKAHVTAVAAASRTG